jgi:small-conductance mechanosensitive channel
MTEIREEIRERHTRLDQLKDDLDKIQEEQVLATQEAEKKRKEADRARTRSLWLESPLHPHNIMTWAVTHGPKILIVFVLLALLLLIIRIFSKRIAALIIRHGPGEVEMREKRVTTLASTFRGAMSGLVVICGFLFLLEVAGMDLKTVLGGAAVVGLAVAFGAQNLMRDYFNGFMILMEGQYELNDWIKIGDVSGAVERITLRITTLRDLEGCAHFIPNGEIKRVTNMTHKWSQALIDIGVTYKEDVDRVMGILMDIAKELRNDGAFKAFIIDEPVMLGVNLFTESGVVIRMLITTRAGMQWAVRREMLRRVKNKFDEAGIEIPVPHRVIFQRLEKGAEQSPVLKDS